MSGERQDADAREVRLEGVGLVAALGLLVAAQLGAFYLGRWFERDARPLASARAPEDPLRAVIDEKPPADAAAGLTTFDDARGEGKQLEPQREARPAPARTEPAMGGTAGGAGPFFVQVFAGRDRAAADRLVQELRAAGQPVRVVTESESGGTLYKVRVGGYGAEGGARAAADQLRRAGYTGAWVTRVD
jgi:cell division protein FtsN